MRTHCSRLFTCLILVGSMLYAGSPAMARDTSQAPNDGFFGAMGKSLTGDVYGDPSKWRELSLSNFFTEGWNRAWVSPPPGGGGAPRQGWLNSFDGVFYRLAVGTYGYADNFLDNGTRTRASFKSTCRSTNDSSFAWTFRWSPIRVRPAPSTRPILET
jgi:hypothetical protein